MLTPGRSPDFDSCIRTLMVSNGWHVNCTERGTHQQPAARRRRIRGLLTASAIPAIPPAVMCVAKPTFGFEESEERDMVSIRYANLERAGEAGVFSTAGRGARFRPMSYSTRPERRSSDHMNSGAAGHGLQVAAIRPTSSRMRVPVRSALVGQVSAIAIAFQDKIAGHWRVQGRNRNATFRLPTSKETNRERLAY